MGRLSSEEASQKCLSLGVSSALMIILGYPGELIVEGNLAERWKFWAVAVVPFCYIVYELLVGLAAATASETDPRVRDLVFHARLPWGPGCSEHPGGILRLGRHLQMRCWAHHP